MPSYEERFQCKISHLFITEIWIQVFLSNHAWLELPYQVMDEIQEEEREEEEGEEVEEEEEEEEAEEK